ncbi:general amidase [Guyanagaster necrorhizus]|uniref:amidase n=1 Tax=Guyanagaster necrorhizus TaxID=856835 RepID=A0A9P8AZX3_9AGAR|nr:general amidase [Guyanagaster necrorhizus MCA 3950]KAG7452407.1 general amidase [Guyanagaster necrorhizus MCA 3950]
MTWQEAVSEKRKRQLASIPQEWTLASLPSKDHLDISVFPDSCGLLTPTELEITRSEIDGLLSKLAKGDWTSVQVTTAFYKRAIIAHQLTNCLTEIFVEKALAKAAECDDYLKQTGKVLGPLHGLPVSLKDQINIKGIESTMGYVSWIGTFAERNAVLVDMLDSLGAVPFVKTNVPQTLMWGETFNNIFGRTCNPHNRSLTSGGSSGGEGALLALRGSPLGIGSDIGGSIRIPSSFCGIYGLRPSHGRVPYAGCVNSMEGQDSIMSVLGPMSNSLSGLKCFMKAVVDAKPWYKDALVIPKAWSEEDYRLVNHGGGKLLCFGILWDDRCVVPNPPIIRALEMTKKALLAAGHKVVDWEPFKHDALSRTSYEIWGAGCDEDYRVVAQISGEPVISTMGPDGNSEPGESKHKGGISAYKLWQVQKQKRDLRQEYLEYWQATQKTTGTGRPVDAIISPVAPYAAPPHGFNRITDYTRIWNVLDYTTLVIPVSKVDRHLDVKKLPHKFYSDRDKDNYDRYDPETFRNAPVAVQIVGRTLEEEAVIGMAEIVDTALKATKSQTASYL